MASMTVSQLRNNRAEMVKDLEEINWLLDDLIQEQSQTGNNTLNLQKEIMRLKRVKRSLIKSLSDFEFMLTGDYSVKIQQEIERVKEVIKSNREEVNKFTRMLQVPL